MNQRLTRYCWAVLGFTTAVILWGAWVRISGSGAGCGNHWPLCNGEVIPLAPDTKMLVEFTHRITSGLSLLLVVVMFVWCRKALPQKHPARIAAFFSLIFILSEALIGAGLVLLELVANNSTPARAAIIAAHLVNSFALIAAIALTAWWSSSGSRLLVYPLAMRKEKSLLVASIVGMLVVGTTGAITALGDTLFPPTSLREGLLQDLDPLAHFLIRLRVWHPIVAILVAALLIYSARALKKRRPFGRTPQLAKMLIVIVHLQIVLGGLTVFFLAPTFLQISHLLLADFCWITLILLGANFAFISVDASEDIFSWTPSEAVDDTQIEKFDEELIANS